MSAEDKEQSKSAAAQQFILANIESRLGNRNLRKLLRRGDLGMWTDPVNLRRRLENFTGYISTWRRCRPTASC